MAQPVAEAATGWLQRLWDAGPPTVLGLLLITTVCALLGYGLPASAPSLGELALQAKQNLQAPWLGFATFFTFAIMLSLLVFIFEGIRDAFDPRKTFK